MSTVGGALTDARDEDNAGGRLLARATRDRLVDGQVMLGPNARPPRRRGRMRPTRRRSCRLRRPGADLPDRARHRMTREEIEALHPELITHARRAIPGSAS